MDKEKAQTKIIEISKYTSLITIFMYIDQTCQLKTEISRLDKQKRHIKNIKAEHDSEIYPANKSPKKAGKAILML